MKRLIAFSMCLVLLLLCGCQTTVEPKQPFQLYFRRAEPVFSDNHGVIAPETVDFGDQSITAEGIVSRFLQGPTEENLTQPFPKGTEMISVRVTGSTVTVTLQGSAFTSEINASVADACLAKTLLQLPQIEHVQLNMNDNTGALVHEAQLSSNDIVLYDDSSDTSSTVLVLYFTDESNRYLLAEKRTIPFVEESAMAKAVVEQLLSGPKNPSLSATMPEGTSLLDLNVENGVCVLYFNRDFYENRPQEQLAERMTLLSLIDSLTDLEEINAVHIYVEGRRLSRYYLLDASLFEASDVTAIGPIRADLSELDASIYLYSLGDHLLHLAPMRVRTGNNETTAEAVIRTITETAPLNGFANPLYQAGLTGVSMHGETCVVNFAAGTDFGEDLAGIRCLTASLTQLEGIENVQILVDGVPVQSNNGSLWTAENAWYCISPEE